MSFGFSSMNVTVTLVRTVFIDWWGKNARKRQWLQITLVNLAWEIQAEENVSPREVFLLFVCLRVRDIRECLSGVWKVWLENKRLKRQNWEHNHQSKVLRWKEGPVWQNDFRSVAGCLLYCDYRRDRGLVGGEFLSDECDIIHCQMS